MDRRDFFRLSAAGFATTVLPLGACSTASLPTVDRSPGALAFAADGTRFEVAGNAHSLLITTPAGSTSRVGGLGTTAGKLNYPGAVVVVEDLAYVVEVGNHRVQVFDKTGASVGVLGDTDLLYPHGITATRDGRIFVADTRNARIVEYAPDGDMVSSFGHTVLSAPRGLAIADGDLLVADPGLRKVLELGTDGKIVRELRGAWVLPYGVASDGTNVFIADYSKPELAVLDRSGRPIETVALDAAPSFVTLASDGMLYVG